MPRLFSDVRLGATLRGRSFLRTLGNRRRLRRSIRLYTLAKIPNNFWSFPSRAAMNLLNPIGIHAQLATSKASKPFAKVRLQGLAIPREVRPDGRDTLPVFTVRACGGLLEIGRRCYG